MKRRNFLKLLGIGASAPVIAALPDSVKKISTEQPVSSIGIGGNSNAGTTIISRGLQFDSNLSDKEYKHWEITQNSDVMNTLDYGDPIIGSRKREISFTLVGIHQEYIAGEKKTIRINETTYNIYIESVDICMYEGGAGETTVSGEIL